MLAGFAQQQTIFFVAPGFVANKGIIFVFFCTAAMNVPPPKKKKRKSENRNRHSIFGFPATDHWSRAFLWAYARDKKEMGGLIFSLFERSACRVVKMGRVLLYSFFVFLAGAFFYSLFFLEWFFQFFFPAFSPESLFLALANALFLFSIFGALLEFIGAFFSKKTRHLRYEPLKKPAISVGMLAYNDGLSIGGAVRGFKELPEIVNITVIDNNSVDNTASEARKAGAQVVPEPVQGYGAACIRALTEARKRGNLVCLVEGDQTYIPSDIRKLLSYIENGDLVLGTRTTMELVAPDSQITPIILYGNIFIAKLIQLRYWGTFRLTDVGIGFMLIRPQALDRILPDLKVTGNHFSPHLILTALKHDLKVIECPIAFRKRVGKSKGVGSSMTKGLVNGLKMIWLVFIA